MPAFSRRSVVLGLLLTVGLAGILAVGSRWTLKNFLGQVSSITLNSVALNCNSVYIRTSAASGPTATLYDNTLAYQLSGPFTPTTSSPYSASAVGWTWFWNSGAQSLGQNIYLCFGQDGSGHGTNCTNSVRLTNETPSTSVGCRFPAAAVTDQYVDYSVTLSGPTSSLAGNTITYTATVTNAGPDTTGMRLHMPQPGLYRSGPAAGMTYASGITFNASLSTAGCTSTRTDDRGGDIYCDIGSFAPGTRTFQIAFSTVQNPCPSGFDFTADVSAYSTAVNGVTHEVNASNNTSNTVSTTFACPSSSSAPNNPTADMSIAMTGPTTISPGGTATYTITIVNAGPDDVSIGQAFMYLTNVNPSFSYNAAQSDPACSVNGAGELTCRRAVAHGQSTSFQIVLGVGTMACNQSKLLQPVVSAQATDPNSTNNTASPINLVYACGGASSSSSAPVSSTPTTDYYTSLSGDATAVIGTPFRFLGMIGNGSTTAASLTLNLPLPSGITFNAPGSDPTCRLVNNAVSCTASVLPGVQGFGISLIAGASVACNTTRSFTETVTPTDANPANNTSATVTTTFTCVSSASSAPSSTPPASSSVPAASASGNACTQQNQIVTGSNYFPQILTGSDGLPLVLFTSQSERAVKVAKCANANCTSASSITKIADLTAGTMGRTAFMNIGPDGIALIANIDASTNSLKLYRCGNASCSANNTSTTIDQVLPSSVTTLIGNAIAFNAGGMPVLTYLSPTQVKVVTCGNASCTAGNTVANLEAINTTSSFVTPPSILIPPGSNPIVAYAPNLFSTPMRIIRCGDATCSSNNNNINASWDPNGIITSPLVLAISTSNQLMVAFSGKIGTDFDKLRVFTCMTSDCRTYQIPALDLASNHGKVSMVIPSSGLPVLAYNFEEGPNQYARIAKCNDAYCVATPTVSQFPDGFYNPSIAIASDGKPILSYMDYMSGTNMGKIYTSTCDNASCSCSTFQTVAGPGATGDLSAVISGPSSVMNYQAGTAFTVSLANLGSVRTYFRFSIPVPAGMSVNAQSLIRDPQGFGGIVSNGVYTYNTLSYIEPGQTYTKQVLFDTNAVTCSTTVSLQTTVITTNLTDTNAANNTSPPLSVAIPCPPPPSSSSRSSSALSPVSSASSIPFGCAACASCKSGLLDTCDATECAGLGPCVFQSGLLSNSCTPSPAQCGSSSSALSSVPSSVASSQVSSSIASSVVSSVSPNAVNECNQPITLGPNAMPRPPLPGPPLTRIDGDLSFSMLGDPTSIVLETSAAVAQRPVVLSESFLPTDNHPIFVYVMRDSLNRDLIKFVKCFNNTCTNRASQFFDAQMQTFDQANVVSMLADSWPDGRTVIAYRQRSTTTSDEEIRQFSCGNPGCTSGFETSLVTTSPIGVELISLSLAPSYGIPVVLSRENSTQYKTNGAAWPFQTPSPAQLGADGSPVIQIPNRPVIKCSNLTCACAAVSSSSPAPQSSISSGVGSSASFSAPPLTQVSATTSTACLAHTAVDSGGNSGYAPSIAVQSNGRPTVGYFDVTNKLLKVLSCGNPACLTNNTFTTADTEGTIGVMQASLRLLSDGSPVASYYDSQNQDLKFIKCGNAACTSGNILTTVDGPGNVGAANAMVLGGDGNPVIAYFDDLPNADLKVAKCGNASCTSGNVITRVDSAGSVGDGVSIALGNDGLPVISYQDKGNAYLKVLKCGTPSCAANNTITTIDASGLVGATTSIAIGSDGFPVIAYQRGQPANTSLVLAKCSNAACSAVSGLSALDAGSAAGNAVSVAIGNSGFPVLNYYQGTLKILFCGNASCTNGNVRMPVESQGNIGLNTALAIGTDTFPVMSYYDGTAQDLKIAKCLGADCLCPPPPPSSSSLASQASSTSSPAQQSSAQQSVVGSSSSFSSGSSYSSPAPQSSAQQSVVGSSSINASSTTTPSGNYANDPYLCGQCVSCGAFAACDQVQCALLGPCLFQNGLCRADPVRCGGTAQVTFDANNVTPPPTINPYYVPNPNGGFFPPTPGTNGTSFPVTPGTNGPVLEQPTPLENHTSSATIVATGPCHQNECQRGGTYGCSLQGKSCENINALPCMRCVLSSTVHAAASSRPTDFVAPTGTIQQGVLCRSDHECASGLCLQGQCVSCGIGAACGSGKTCVQGRCMTEAAPSLTLGFCGDSIRQTGEECDDGQKNSAAPNTFCRPDCRIFRCGDGVVDPPLEACDDGNTVNGDGCSVLCAEEAATPSQVLHATTIELPFAPGVAPLPPTESVLDFPPPPAPVSYEPLSAELLPVPPHAPVGSTGPETLVIMIAGASAGLAWMRRKKSSIVENH